MRIFVHLLTVTLALSAHATVFYVSPTGNDLNSGTSPATAWKQIEVGRKKLLKGDTLSVLGGDYPELVGATGGWVSDTTISSYSNQVVRVLGKPGTTPTLFVGNGSYTNLTLSGIIWDGKASGQQGVPVVKVTDGSVNVTITNCGVVNGFAGHGILVSGGSTLYPDGFTLIDSYVLDNGGAWAPPTNPNHAIYLGGSKRNKIKRNRIGRQSGWGNLVDGLGKGLPVNAHGVHVYYDTDQDSENIIEDNEIFGTYTAVGLYHSSKNIVRNNVLWGNIAGVSVDYFDGQFENWIFNNTLNSNWTGIGNAAKFGNLFIANNSISTNVDGSGILLMSGAGPTWASNNFSVAAKFNTIADNSGRNSLVQSSNRTTGSPGFVDAGKANYRLTDTSALKDWGITLAAVPLDKVGLVRPQQTRYAVGAFEPSGIMPPIPPDPPVTKIETLSFTEISSTGSPEYFRLLVSQNATNWDVVGHYHQEAGTNLIRPRIKIRTEPGGPAMRFFNIIPETKAEYETAPPSEKYGTGILIFLK